MFFFKNRFRNNRFLLMNIRIKSISSLQLSRLTFQAREKFFIECLREQYRPHPSFERQSSLKIFANHQSMLYSYR